MTALGAVLLIGIVLLLVWRLWPAGPARIFKYADRRRGRLNSHRIEVNGRRWHYLEGGHGEPLVLLHGFNADADHFCRVARFLTGHFRILAPDLPGFGDTPAGEDTEFRIEHQAEIVTEWLDALGIQRCFLGGNSMGGYIACAVARAQPERVRALWLLAPGGIRTVELSPLYREIEAGHHNPLIVRHYADFQRLTDYCFVHPPRIPGVLRRYLAHRAASHAPMHQRAFDAIRFDSQPLEELAARLDTPALVVWGRSDQVLNPAGAAVLESVMNHAEVLMLQDTGHLPMLERPCTAAEAWISYTERCARRHEAD